jgi:NADPH:quinone reductase-like Zn-dependent oxidoreductase
LPADAPQTWITATQALHLIGQFEPGQTVLWHAGASSVSIAGIQLAWAAGASAVYVTAGSREKVEFCVEQLGATAGFDYKTQDWAAEIRGATGGAGVDLVVDFVGAPYFQGNVDVAARDARIVCLGLMGGSKLPAGVDIMPILLKRLRFEGSTLRSRDLEYQEKLRDKLETYLPKFEDGSFKLFIDRVFPWESVVEAQTYMESDQSKGKIVCKIT